MSVHNYLKTINEDSDLEIAYASKPKGDEPSVFIDEDFWKTYDANKGLLTACFTKIFFSKYPVHEGYESAFNFLIMEFYRQDLFSRFDENKVGKYTQTTIVDKTARKKFEQFVYKWTESILYAIYNKERNSSKRNMRFGDLDTLSDDMYTNFKKERGITSWSEDHHLETDIHQEYRVKKLPCILDIDDFYSDPSTDPLDKLCEEEIVAKIMSSLKNDRERFIVTSKLNGLTSAEICVELDLPAPTVSIILSKIKERCSGVLQVL